MQKLLSIIALFSYTITSAQTNVWGFKEAIKKGDWQRTAELIEFWANDNGFSSDTDLRWEESDLDQLYNFYDESGLTPYISVSTFPTRKNVWTYWNFWSNALTNGTWNPKAHFKNKRQALLMARYNVLMLMTHEYGHHVANRYSAERFPLNCKEFDADRVAYFLNQELSTYAYFNDCPKEYHRLIRAFNAHIPESSRYEISDTTNLISNCVAIPVKYPADTSLMLQYASAYFVRWNFLLNTQPNPESIFDVFYEYQRTIWNRFPANVNCRIEERTSIEDVYHTDFAYNFNRGIKLLRTWGDVDDNFVQVSGFGFDSIGELYNVQVGANKNLSPADLWDVRCYDDRGRLAAYWITSPPFVDTFKYMKMESVAIQSISNDISLLVSIYNEMDQRDQRLFLLVPDDYQLTLNWIEISETKPGDLRVLPASSGKGIVMLSTSDLRPGLKFLSDTNQQLNMFLMTMNPVDSGFVPPATAVSPNGIYTSAPGFLVRMNGDTGSTIFGSGIGRTGEQDVPRSICMRFIGDKLYVLHKSPGIKLRDQFEIRIYGDWSSSL